MDLPSLIQDRTHFCLHRNLYVIHHFSQHCRLSDILKNAYYSAQQAAIGTESLPAILGTFTSRDFFLHYALSMTL